MDEDTLKKILADTEVKQDSETLSECSCTPCVCGPSIAGEEDEETRESIKSSTEEEEEEEDLFDELSILSEDRNLAYRKRVLCDRKAKPFTLKWCFGITVSVPVVNLSNRFRGVVLYAADNMGVIYDYNMGTMRLLHGHKNLLQSISTERMGNFIVSADNGEDSTIIIWDANTCIPIHTIFNKPENYNTNFVAISPNGKYLITILLSDHIKILFWLWTYGKDDPDYVFEVKSDVGACKNVCYHPNCQEHVMIAFEKQIIFFFWNEEKGSLIETACPTMKKGKSHFTDCTYVQNCHECMASTRDGCILVFGNTLYVRNFEEAALDNSKYYVKTIRITKCSLNVMRSTEEMIVTGDDLGRILFFDKTVKLLFWLTDFKICPIISLSFNLALNIDYNVKDFDVDTSSLDESYTRSSEYTGYEDFSNEIAIKLPSDATSSTKALNLKEFIIMTEDGSVYVVQPTIKEIKLIMGNNDSFVTAIDTHCKCPYLVVGYKSGKLSLYDYISHQLVSKYVLPNDSNNEPIPVTCIKYSPKSLRLACGRANGELWFLDSVLLKETQKPLKITSNNVVKICFSPDELFAAYYDSKMTVISLYYENDEWRQCGKVRSHYKPIKDIMFSPYKPKWKLLTIGEDRCLIQYNVDAKCTGILDIESRERIEQSAIPYCFVYYPLQEGCREHYILLADNQNKYKIITDSNFMIRRVLLGPSYGCYQEYPVRKLTFMPDKKYLVFMTNRCIGFQLIPTDGSPFDYIGMISHPKKLGDCCLSENGKYLFSFGENERVIFCSRTNPKAADFVSTAGGPELEPFYSLIEGGSTGWLFSEMKDLFYYMQILHQGENTVMPRIVNDTIPIVELPDLMKACGYYPSEYDTETLIIDAKYRNFDYNFEIADTISFVEFVKLYLNHRPTHGISREMLKEAFLALQLEAPETKAEIEKEHLIEVLTNRGESFGVLAIQKCLQILLNIGENYNVIDNFEYLPPTIDFDYFANEILGIDMNRKVDEEPKKRVERRNTSISQH